MLVQNSTLESLLKYSESHANTEYKSTTTVSFSCRGYSAASHSSRSHANAGELVQQSLSLCFFSGWTWSFITTCITNLFLVLGGSWKKKESCYITVRRWVFDCTVLPCTSWFYIWWNETKTMRDFEAITKIHRNKSQITAFLKPFHNSFLRRWKGSCHQRSGRKETESNFSLGSEKDGANQSCNR